MSAELPHLLFLIFATLAVIFSVLVITMNNPVRSALALVFAGRVFSPHSCAGLCWRSHDLVFVCGDDD